MANEKKNKEYVPVNGTLNTDIPSIEVNRLYKEVFPNVKDFVLSNSGCIEDAKDMFQEAMSVLWVRTVSNADFDSSNPGGFVYRVAKNKWLDQVRSARHKTKARLVVDTNDTAEEDYLESNERIAHLEKLYAQLDEKCRKVLDLYYYEKQALKTIAETVGVDEGSIRTIKYRCMMKLRAFNKKNREH